MRYWFEGNRHLGVTFHGLSAHASVDVRDLGWVRELLPAKALSSLKKMDPGEARIVASALDLPPECVADLARAVAADPAAAARLLRLHCAARVPLALRGSCPFGGSDDLAEPDETAFLLGLYAMCWSGGPLWLPLPSARERAALVREMMRWPRSCSAGLHVDARAHFILMAATQGGSRSKREMDAFIRFVGEEADDTLRALAELWFRDGYSGPWSQTGISTVKAALAVVAERHLPLRGLSLPSAAHWKPDESGLLRQLEELGLELPGTVSIAVALSQGRLSGPPWRAEDVATVAKAVAENPEFVSGPTPFLVVCLRTMGDEAPIRDALGARLRAALSQLPKGGVKKELGWLHLAEEVAIHAVSLAAEVPTPGTLADQALPVIKALGPLARHLADAQARFGCLTAQESSSPLLSDKDVAIAIEAMFQKNDATADDDFQRSLEAAVACRDVTWKLLAASLTSRNWRSFGERLICLVIARAPVSPALVDLVAMGVVSTKFEAFTMPGGRRGWLVPALRQRLKRQGPELLQRVRERLVQLLTSPENAAKEVEKVDALLEGRIHRPVTAVFEVPEGGQPVPFAKARYDALLEEGGMIEGRRNERVRLLVVDGIGKSPASISRVREVYALDVDLDPSGRPTRRGFIRMTEVAGTATAFFPQEARWLTQRLKVLDETSIAAIHARVAEAPGPQTPSFDLRHLDEYIGNVAG